MNRTQPFGAMAETGETHLPRTAIGSGCFLSAFHRMSRRSEHLCKSKAIILNSIIFKEPVCGPRSRNQSGRR